MSTLLSIGLAIAVAAAALAVLAYLIGRTGRRPALTHALWLLVLLKLVTPPLFLVGLPFLPAESAVVVETPPPEPPPPVEELALFTGLDRFPSGAAPTAAPLILDTTPVTAAPIESIPLPPAEKPAVPRITYNSDPYALLLLVWLGGVLLVVGRAVLTITRFQRLLTHARLAPEDVQRQTAELAERMGLSCRPQVWLVPGPLPPMVWAVGRARVLFPAGLLDRLDGEARASLLAHELAHVRRRDHWVRWLELVVLGLYWWYPLAWVARRQLQAREEECCDAWAASQVEPRVYAGAILDAVDFLAEARPRLPAVASPLNGARSLRERLTLIMSGDAPRRLTWLGRLVLLAFAVATLPLLPSLTRRAESAAPPSAAAEAKEEFAESEPAEFARAVDLNQGDDDVFSVAVSPDGRRVAAGMGNSFRPGKVQVWDLGSHDSLWAIDEPRGVSSVAFAPDGKRLAWSGWGGRVNVNRLDPSEKALDLHLSGNQRVAYSGDGKWLAVAGEGRSLRLLDATTGRLSRMLLGESTSYYGVAFSPRNDYLAAAGGSFQEKGPGGPNLVNVFDVNTGDLVTKLTGHKLAVMNVAFSARGDLIATASADQTVRVYDGKSFKLRHTLMGHTDAVKGVAFSPDGRTLATGSWDRTVRLWDVAAGKELARLEGHPGAVREIAFTPDGRHLVSGGALRSVKLWDVKTHKEVATLRQDDAGLPAQLPALVLAASPDGKLLATGTEDGMVALANAVTGQLVRTLKGHEDAVTALAFSPDGKRLASGGPDTSVKLWDVASGKVVREMNGHSSWVYSLAFSGDGRALASGSYDRTVRLWDADTGTAVGVLEGHKASVRGLAFSPDGLTLASGGGEHHVRLWDVKTLKSLGVLKGHAAAVRAVLFDRDGKHLFSTGEDGLLKRWDVRQQSEVHSVRAHSGEAICLALSPRGEVLMSGGQDGYIRTWSPRTLTLRQSRYAHEDGVISLGYRRDGRRVYSLGGNRLVRAADAMPGPLRRFEGHTGPVRVVTFSPDGRYLLSCGGWPQGDKTLRLWNVKTGEQERLFTTAKQHIQSAAFTPDGRHAVSGCDDGVIRLWDVSTGLEVRRFLGHREGIPHLVFSADGKWLLSSGHDKTVRLWDVEAGKEARTFTGHTDWARCAVFHPDGKRILSGGRDRVVRVWDRGTGQLIQTIDHNKEWVETLAVLPDGKRFLAGGGNAMRLWDVDSGKAVKTYAAHAQGVTCVALAKDGKTALSTSYDGETRLWDVEAGAELRRYGSHREWVWGVSLSPDGKTFVTAGGGGQTNGQYVAGEDFAIRLWKMPEVR